MLQLMHICIIVVPDWDFAKVVIAIVVFDVCLFHLYTSDVKYDLDYVRTSG